MTVLRVPNTNGSALHQHHLTLPTLGQRLQLQPLPLRRAPRQHHHSIAASSGNTSGNGSPSEDEEPEPQQRLQRCNSFQQSVLDHGPAPHLKSICCWGKEDLPRHHTSRRGVTNQVQLSTYADCIGDDLTDLEEFLRLHIGDAIGSVHLLPLYPSTGDRGFAPVTYQEVDPRFGNWGNVRQLADEYQLCLEYMVNHISPASPQFQDYIQHGGASRFSDMFVKWTDIWPEGKPNAEMLAKVRTRKPAPPVLEVELADGSKVPLWCTFSDQQIDINPFSEEGWKFTESSLRSLCKNGGAKLIRLDAFGYVTKKAGTSCFMQEPGVWDLLQRIKQVVKPFGVQLLCEVHEDFNLNVELAGHGYWVYDFALPMLLLHALRFKTAEPLRNWLSICPRRQITTLDTHDGMGVDDVAGLAPLVDIWEVEQCIVGHGGTINYKHFFDPHTDASGTSSDEACPTGRCSVSSQASLEAVKDYLQPDCLKGCYTSVEHQYNATYFSAMGEDPKSYLLARAVQFFTPGVPMVYYVGLLAGRNDYELLAQGSIRDINRHYYSVEEAEEAVRRPVVQALLRLCRFRNYHPAFKGRVFIDDSMPPHVLRVCWYLGTQHIAVLRADFEASEFSIRHTPYKTPSGADVVEEEEELHSDYSLDLADVFSIDALDLTARAAVRTKVAPAPAAETGMVCDILDPQRHSMAPAPGQHPDSLPSASNGNGNGGSTSASTTNHSASSTSAAPADAAANPRWVNAGGASAESTMENTSEEEQEQERMVSKEVESGLLQLDLAFAWSLKDKPLDDVQELLRERARARVAR